VTVGAPRFLQSTPAAATTVVVATSAAEEEKEYDHDEQDGEHATFHAHGPNLANEVMRSRLGWRRT
jgi:hypothetical protein